MAALVTLEQAKKSLNLPPSHTHEDDKLLMKLTQAQAAVLEYLADSTDATWTAVIAAWDDTTVPLQVQAGILQLVGYLYGFRGDDPAGWKMEHGDLPPDVKMFLYRLRKPVIA